MSDLQNTTLSIDDYYTKDEIDKKIGIKVIPLTRLEYEELDNSSNIEEALYVITDEEDGENYVLRSEYISLLQRVQLLEEKLNEKIEEDFSIQIKQGNISMNIGETSKLEVVFKPEDIIDDSLVWSSSNTNVVSVNNGLITSNEVGQVIVTVHSTKYNLSATCEVDVVKIDLEQMATPNELICLIHPQGGCNLDQTSVLLDETSNGNDMTLNKFAYTETSGWKNYNTLTFDSIRSGDYASIKLNNISLDSEFTVNIGVENLILNPKGAVFILNGTLSSVYGLGLETGIEGVYLKIGSNKQSNIFTTKTNFFITFVYKSSDVIIYLDGEPYTTVSRAQAGLMDLRIKDFYLGGGTGREHAAFDFKLFTAYSKALELDEVQENFLRYKKLL